MMLYKVHFTTAKDVDTWWDTFTSLSDANKCARSLLRDVTVTRVTVDMVKRNSFSKNEA